jgi:murein DD-endopeptidase MepM/ murein hydrolase activator NlpD
MIRWLVRLLILAVIAVGALYVVAGRGAPPGLVIVKPDRPVGQEGTLEVLVEGPRPATLTITLQQEGRDTSLFTLDAPQSAVVTPGEGGAGLRVVRPFGKRGAPELRQGQGRIVVQASRPSLLGLRTLSSSTARDIQVRLEPPRVAAISTHHHINHGGSEMVVYRALPPDVASGVRVGTLEYPGYPASGAGIGNADASFRVAFFALLPEQPLSASISLFARDEAGNEATASFVNEVFKKPFKKSRIELNDGFLRRVVPDILSHSPELKLGPLESGTVKPGSAESDSADNLLPPFLRINGDLRRLNAERIVELTNPTSPSILWNGPFVQLGNSQVEARFADQRTYIYRGKVVDQQVHLGFDLAVTSAVSVVAANAGKVVNASWLGIYGNCVVIDHGMGVASLYGHLSWIDVKVGDAVTKRQVIGKSGMTGLAGGDHLHFTMLVHGQPVNPVEWWDSHWIQDRIERKLREAGGNPIAAR